MVIDKQKIAAIGITEVVCGALTAWGIYAIGAYGWALFILTPVILGMGPIILYGRKNTLTKVGAQKLGFTTLGIFTLGLLVTATEGLICLIMAAPVALVLTWIGTWLGIVIVRKAAARSSFILAIAMSTIPTTAFVEKDYNDDADLIEIKTSVVIQAPQEKVWQLVVAFPQIPDPEEFVFKTGIAYPVNATIEGTGKGAIRYCNFSTGSFVEPITIWDEPALLAFDVLEQPVPMKEISFYNNLDAPHLHDYFVSKKGQFHLIRLDDDRTLLEGTTWYYNKIAPGFYWKLWSDYIIHKIHSRVLNLVKTEAEKSSSVAQ